MLDSIASAPFLVAAAARRTRDPADRSPPRWRPRRSSRRRCLPLPRRASRAELVAAAPEPAAVAAVRLSLRASRPRNRRIRPAACRLSRPSQNRPHLRPTGRGPAPRHPWRARRSGSGRRRLPGRLAGGAAARQADPLLDRRRNSATALTIRAGWLALAGSAGLKESVRMGVMQKILRAVAAPLARACAAADGVGAGPDPRRRDRADPARLLRSAVRGGGLKPTT